MPRKHFDQELEQLSERITGMGDAINDRIVSTVKALRTGGVDTAQRVAENDSDIDRMEHENEKLCMNLIASQQPLAGDLRIIAASLKILTDMERVADQCADICEILTTSGVPDSQSLPVNHIVSALLKVQDMFTGAMDVYLSRDVRRAEQICAADDEVDAAFGRIVLEVSSAIMRKPEDVMQDVDLLFIIKYVERIGDHATNIAEWVIYMVTGEHPDLNEGEETPAGHIPHTSETL